MVLSEYVTAVAHGADTIASSTGPFTSTVRPGCFFYFPLFSIFLFADMHFLRWVGDSQ